ncbi:DUF2066 domain-containing protein [Algibacillus agarilyticus]|uniref:DUF2066 domain-containing protein n=1 Tax=Algibacillus agarilyticus TaxID=2234133 RepID=UPI000DD0E1E5|nr:DUF2066 domain-containing protein [Algibacillus agarilyticus]
MIKISAFIVFGFCSALFLSVQAVEVADLYKASISVPDQSQNQRKVAYRDALENVLIRVAGKKHIKNNSEIKSAIRTANKYVTRYAYRRVIDDLFLDIDFNPKAVNNLLKQNEYAIWGARRPLTLIWLAEQQGQFERSIVAEDAAAVIEQYQPRAKERGIPVIFPIMDFDDAMQIQANDIWGRFEAPIIEASHRYQPDVIASIKVFQQDSNEKNAQNSFLSANWLGQVSLLLLDKPLTVELTGNSKAQIALDALDWIADQLGEHYAIKAQAYQSDLANVYLTFADINNMTQALNLERYLNSLSPIANARIYQVNQFGVQFEVELLGEAIDVITVLDLDERVKAVKPQFGEILPVENYYTWTDVSP